MCKLSLIWRCVCVGVDIFDVVGGGLFSAQLLEGGHHLGPDPLVGWAVKEEDDAAQDAVDDGEDRVERHVLRWKAAA